MHLKGSELTDMDRLVLTRFPYPIAVGYRRVLDAPTWEEKVRSAIDVFDYGTRTLTLGLIRRYLLDDDRTVEDAGLNTLLKSKLPTASLGTWTDILFSILWVYKEHRDRF